MDLNALVETGTDKENGPDRRLKKVQILRETTGRKRDKLYVYSDYLDILAEGTKI
jgi:hypothetical protein